MALPMPPLPWEKQIPFSEAQLDTLETQPVPLETPTMASETQAGPGDWSRLRVELSKSLETGHRELDDEFRQ